jgi:hypothetical protein
VINIFGYHPVFMWIHFRHGEKNRGYKGGTDEVENDDLEKFVILIFSQAVNKGRSE